ncbi:MAG TPA: rod shape-determining protein MreD [Woeseiaceae bacterium]|nr:rod shape-determining protein MreD [Woeseiaceae bacterium]
MSNGRNTWRLPVLLSIVVALMLGIVPLPAAVEAFRPDWVALTLIYWAMTLPRSYSVGTAWIVGIVVDAAHGTLLGQHALALCFVIYVTVKFHLQLRVFPLSQMTATVFALLALYQFLLFWINGVAGLHTDAVTYWGPVVSGTLIWPLLSMLFAGIRYRVRSDA